MYEFLAPWGVLAPAICGALVYAIVSNIRRKRLLNTIQAPEGTRKLRKPTGTVDGVV